MISKYAGLKQSEILTRKLSFILKGLPETELANWVESIIKDPYKTELPALVEDLNNHETYFFRDVAQMRVLTEKILPEMIDKKIAARDFTITIWSAACSSGEEVYTLAMILLQVFIDKKLSLKLKEGLILPPTGWKIQINGTDISRQVIRKASEGIYESSARGLSSFRNFPQEYMQFFTLAKEYEDSIGNKKQVYHVNEVVKSFVKFDIFNLMNPIPPVRNCDLVLCRNVMIYLHEEAQTHVEMVVRSSLRPGGIFMFSAVDHLSNTIGVHVRNEHGCVYYEKK
jgi:chemotaxis protein methyltransferase CheR